MALDLVAFGAHGAGIVVDVLLINPGFIQVY